MHTVRSVNPIERYRAIIHHLGTERDSWSETYWLRFAAQAAVLTSDDPDILATRIRNYARELLDNTKWYQTLASPARFVIAALLIQHHIPLQEFLVEYMGIGDLLGKVGLRHGGFYETMTVIIQRLSPGHRPLNRLEAERIKAIYDRMKKLHWWLTGPDDLPACAALAQCPGSADMVVARSESVYQQLHDAGLAAGDHLQTTANLLTLSDNPTNAAVGRYLELKRVLGARMENLGPVHYDSLAVLVSLDHLPQRVAERLLAVVSELDVFQPDQTGPANFLIATDLTFLELVRLDSHGEPRNDPQEFEAMQRIMQAFHIASAVLISQIDIDARIISGPMGIGFP